MLFSDLAAQLTESFPSIVSGVASDRQIYDVALYKSSVVIPHPACLAVCTPDQLAPEFALPASILCVGTVNQKLYSHLQCCGSNYIIVPEANSTEIICQVMELFGDTARQQRTYSDLIYMLYSDVDLGSVFTEFRRQTGCTMLAIDVSGKVVAASKPFVTNHMHWNKSVEMGYLDQFLIEFIRSRRERNNYDMSTAPFQIYCNILKAYVRTVRVVVDGELIGYVFMGNKTEDFPPDNDRLMQAFAKKVKSMLMSSGSYTGFRANMHQNILSDLISGAGEEEILQRIRSANLTFPANMRVLAMKTSFYRGGATYLYSTIMPAISAILPATPKLIKNENVIVLIEVDSSGNIDPDEYEKLKILAKNHNLYIGISNAFSHPVEFYEYYLQAHKVLSVAKRSPGRDGLFYFSDFAFYILLDDIGDKALLKHTRLPILQEIEAFDADKNSALYETLKVYAQTGFSKNRTAELMYLHRNTVNYRIQQLENQFHIDFSDPTLLFKLQYSFYIDSFIRKSYSDLFPQTSAQVG